MSGLHRAFSALHCEDGVSVEPSGGDKLVVEILVEQGTTSVAELRDELPAVRPSSVEGFA